MPARIKLFGMNLDVTSGRWTCEGSPAVAALLNDAELRIPAMANDRDLALATAGVDYLGHGQVDMSAHIPDKSWGENPPAPPSPLVDFERAARRKAER
jgi:hypothetical protein